MYTELGVALRKRGVFYSHPVCIEKETTPIGVVVIESSFAVIEEELRQERGGTALLTDPNGVIFASSRKDWLYNELWQITPEKGFEIAESRQFDEGPWSWTSLKKRRQVLL